MRFTAEQLRRIVEGTDWDNELIRQHSKIDVAYWAIVAIAAVYLGIVLVAMFAR